MSINVKVENKHAHVIGAPLIVCGNSDYSITFDFDAEWADAAAKTARFAYAQGGVLKHQDVVFSGDVVNVPVLSNVREVYVGVYAGDLRTTTPARICCERSILCGDPIHDEPTEDVYNQIMELLAAGGGSDVSTELAELTKTDAELSNEIAVERARIDNLVTAETVDAELIDIRVGADGVTYASAGEAVRSQVGKLKSTINTVEGCILKRHTLKPYVVEIKSRYCWALNREPDVFKSGDPRYTEDGNQNNAFFKITGNVGDDFVTVVAGGNATPNDIADYANRWSGVISYDGIHYEPCLAWYKDADTLGVWPPLKNDIADGEIGAMWSDSLHLTRRGYIGFAQAVFNANPKHCEKKTYINKWVAGDDAPFTHIGGTMYSNQPSLFNYDAGGYLFANQYRQFRKLNTGTNETTGKRGIAWDVDTQYPTDGYAEIMIGGTGKTVPDIPEGYEIHLDLYINDELADQYIKTTNVLETIYFDYTNAEKIKLEIYLNKQAPSQDNGSGFILSSVYFWENTRNSTTLFPTGAVVGQMFDSWGVFHDGASGKEFSRLINEKAGVTVPFNNHSLGSQTSAWGKSWFYENLQKYHPTIGIVNFGINDYNSKLSAAVAETVLGPDGTSYNNKIDIVEYTRNMEIIAEEAKNNNIQLIVTSNPLDIAGEWYYALADNIG